MTDNPTTKAGRLWKMALVFALGFLPPTAILAPIESVWAGKLHPAAADMIINGLIVGTFQTAIATALFIFWVRQVIVSRNGQRTLRPQPLLALALGIALGLIMSAISFTTEGPSGLSKYLPFFIEFAAIWLIADRITQRT